MHYFLFILSLSFAKDMEIAVENCIVCHEHDANSASLVLAAIERSHT
jgi:hypothetical protein